MALRRVGVSQDLGTDIFQRARALDRLFRGERAHHLRNRRDERVRVGPRVHEQPPEARLLLGRGDTRALGFGLWALGLTLLRALERFETAHWNQA